MLETNNFITLKTSEIKKYSQSELHLNQSVKVLL